MSRSRSRLAADWFSKLRQNLQTGFVEHEEVVEVQTEISEIPPSFEAGVTMLFVQSSAPTGWTKSTAHDNKALRIVSGTAGSGGSAAFTTAFGTPTVTGSLSGSVGATTLSTAQLASHTHSVATYTYNPDSGVSNGVTRVTRKWSLANISNAANATGSNSSHTHSFSGSLSGAVAAIDVQYVDVIIATKD